MRTGLTASLVSHSVLIGLALVGLGQVQELEPQQIEAISVDLVPVEELASIRMGSEQSDVIETDAPAVVDTPDPAELAERTGSTQEDQPNPEETDVVTPAPTVQTAPQPVDRPTPDPVPEPPAEPEPVPEPEPAPEPAADLAPAPTPEPVEEPEPAAPEPVVATEPEETEPAEVVPQPVTRTAAVDRARADYQKEVEAERRRQEEERDRREAEQQRAAEERRAQEAEEAEIADRVADIINSEESRGATTGSGGQASAGQATGQAARLTQSELGALIAQMRRCWNPTLQERNDGVVIRLMVALNRDGTVSGQPQILSDASGLLGISARTAQRKVQSCGPFQLPADKYEHWQQIDVTLDASQTN